MYKVILFDLDGTLTDSGEGIMKCVQYALDKIGHPEPDLDNLRVFVGPPLLEECMRYAGVDEETARKAVAYYRERYVQAGIYENRVYEGIGEMLSGLKRRGYHLGVASSKPESFVLRVLDIFGLTGYFEQIVGCEMNGLKTTKAQVIEDALQRFHMEKHRDQVVMVGDRKYDIFGAREAGLECIAVSYGYGAAEELHAAAPMYVAASPQEVLDFFS